MANSHGYVRVAAAVPRVHVADPDKNLQELLALAQQADHARVQVLAFPELALTGYTCGDLFLQPQHQDYALAICNGTELKEVRPSRASRTILNRGYFVSPANLLSRE